MSDPWRFQSTLRELGAAQQPSREELSHIRQGVRDRLLHDARTDPRRGVLLAGATAALTLAVVLAAVVLLPPRRVDQDLVSDVSSEARLGGQVEVLYQGRGAATGVPDDVDIHWEEGTLHAMVEPGKGTSVQVRTPEATVRVVGTIFEVSRDTLGTEVLVERGEVEVTCQGEGASYLGPAEVRRCYRGAEAALQAAREAPSPELALEVIDRGLGLPGEAAAHLELEVWRVEALRSLARDEDALVACEAYLSAGHAHRRLDVLRIASELAFQDEGCLAALPWLEELVLLPGAPPAAALQLESCRAHLR